jgi:phenylacetate-CoA ligase
MQISSDSSQPIDEIRARQLTRLWDGLPQVLAGNAFYRERIQSVHGWDDFDRLPFTTKSELVLDQAANPPFGTNLTYPLERYVRLHQTSGSSGGSPMRWLDTAESWDWWTGIWARHVYGGAGVGPADRVFLAFSFGPFIGFWSAFGGAERLGAMAIPGGAMTTGQRLQTIVELGATVLCCTPTYALRMAEAAQELGIDLPAAAIQRTIHAGEPGASIPATRAAIEESFGARCFDHTGMTELGPTGFGCVEGEVHLIESEFIFETVDGELVATNLGRWGSPAIRYRTGDRVELSREPCGCGSPFVRMVGGILGRVDDMFTVRGVNLYPSQVEAIVRRHPDVTEFVIEHRRERHMDEVTLLLESPEEGVEVRLTNDLRRALGVRIDCRRVEVGTLPRSELKSRRLVKLPEEGRPN